MRRQKLIHSPMCGMVSDRILGGRWLFAICNYFKNLRVKTDIADSMRLTILNFVITDYEFNLNADMTQLTIKL